MGGGLEALVEARRKLVAMMAVIRVRADVVVLPISEVGYEGRESRSESGNMSQITENDTEKAPSQDENQVHASPIALAAAQAVKRASFSRVDSYQIQMRERVSNADALFNRQQLWSQTFAGAMNC